MKIKKGDIVQIMAGKDNRKRGKVLKADPKAGSVLIEGINLFKKHRRPKKQGEKGEVVTVPHFLNISKVQLVCPSCDKPVRAGFREENGNKTRYCKKCQGIL